MVPREGTRPELLTSHPRCPKRMPVRAPIATGANLS
jgi:hypothetical protein